jgi:hypothetical protein
MNSEPASLELSGQQLALYGTLAKRDASLARMYHGALFVLKQSENPDRFALAAHGLRELMEKLPRYLDVPKETKSIGMTAKVRTLYRSWRSTIKKSMCHNNGTWSGKIDKGLQSFLKETQQFFAWVETERPSRKQSAAKILQILDPLERPLPAPIEKLRVDEWDRIHNYFEGVSHHNFPAAVEEFASWLSVLEYFLLDRLIPRTFEDHEKIDQIIREGEGNA